MTQYSFTVPLTESINGAIKSLTENGNTHKATIPTSVYLLVVSLAIMIGTAKLKKDIVTPYYKSNES